MPSSTSSSRCAPLAIRRWPWSFVVDDWLVRSRGLVLLILALAVVPVVACGSSNGTQPAGTGNGPSNAIVGPGPGADPPRLWRNPWNGAREGDTAVYATLRDADGETWVLQGDRIHQTWGAGLDDFGDPAPGVTEIVPVDRRPEGHWWGEPEPPGVQAGTFELADGTTLSTFTVRHGNVVFVVSPEAPFDGVVTETADGEDMPRRSLVSFSRGSGTTPGASSANSE